MGKTLRTVSFGLAMVAGSSSLSADPYCDFFGSRIQAGRIYVAKCANRADCLLGPITRGELKEVSRAYRTVVFAPWVAPTENSVVVAKIKYLAPKPTKVAPRYVELQRDRIPFVCVGSGGVLPQDRAIDAESYEAANKAVTFGDYDRFHRFVELSSRDQKWLYETFHFSYRQNSGQWWWQCPDTIQLDRRRQFLFHSPETAATGAQEFAEVFARTFGPNRAIASGFNEREAALGVYQSLRLRVLALEAGKGPACVSFRLDNSKPGADIAIEDLDRGILQWLMPAADISIRFKN